MGEGALGQLYLGEWPGGGVIIILTGDIHPPKVQVISQGTKTITLNSPQGTVDSALIHVDSSTFYVDDYEYGLIPQQVTQIGIPRVSTISLQTSTTKLNTPAGTVDSSVITVDSSSVFVDDYEYGSIPTMQSNILAPRVKSAGNYHTTILNNPAGKVDSATITVDSSQYYVDDYVSGTISYIRIL